MDYDPYNFEISTSSTAFHGSHLDEQSQSDDTDYRENGVGQTRQSNWRTGLTLDTSHEVLDKAKNYLALHSSTALMSRANKYELSSSEDSLCLAEERNEIGDKLDLHDLGDSADQSGDISMPNAGNLLAQRKCLDLPKHSSSPSSTSREEAGFSEEEELESQVHSISDTERSSHSSECIEADYEEEAFEKMSLDEDLINAADRNKQPTPQFREILQIPDVRKVATDTAVDYSMDFSDAGSSDPAMSKSHENKVVTSHDLLSSDGITRELRDDPSVYCNTASDKGSPKDAELSKSTRKEENLPCPASKNEQMSSKTTKSSHAAVIVREYLLQPTVVEKKDVGTQASGNSVGIQADVPIEGLFSLRCDAAPKSPQEKKPIYLNSSEERLHPAKKQCECKQNVSPQSYETPIGYQFESNDRFRQQLWMIQSRILRKREETDRIIRERSTFSYTEIANTERYIALHRPRKLELWEAIIKVDPDIDVNKAKRIASLVSVGDNGLCT